MELLTNQQWVISYSLIALAIILFIRGVYVVKTKNKRTAFNQLHSFLLKYASHPEQLRIISSEGKELVGTHAGNPLWREAADAICKGMELKHLRYSNVGTAYHLRDVANGKKCEIPTDNRLESKIEDSGLRNGQILAVVENGYHITT